MIIGDNVILQTEQGELVRPSDIGTQVEIGNSTTLKFNNGAVITVAGSPLFHQPLTKRWISLDNMSKGTMFGKPEVFTFSDKGNWDPIINLDKYTSKEGTFDISDERFARLGGWFGKNCYKWYTNGVHKVQKTNTKEDIIEYAKELFPKGAITETDKHFLFTDCWVTELLDAIFDGSNKFSFPDDLLTGAPASWLKTVIEGWFSCMYYDKTIKGYAVKSIPEDFLTDLVVLNQRTNTPFVVSFVEDDNVTKLKYPKAPYLLGIIVGYVNSTPKLLYDIGEGEFNVLGVRLKDN